MLSENALRTRIAVALIDLSGEPLKAICLYVEELVAQQAKENPVAPVAPVAPPPNMVPFKQKKAI
jgi:hypothetical protein